MEDMHRVIPARSVVRRAAVAVVACIALCGCGRSFDYYGKWVAKRDIATPAGGDKDIAATLAKVELTIKQDGRFELFEGGVPKSGTVRFAKDRAYISVDTYFGQPIERAGPEVVAQNAEMSLTPVDSNTLEFHDPKGFDPKPIMLKREAQPAP